MATIATSLLHSTTTSSRSWDARLLFSNSHNFAVDFKDIPIIKNRKASLQLARASSVKGNTRQADEEAEESGQKRSSMSVQVTYNDRKPFEREEAVPSDALRHDDLSVSETSKVSLAGESQEQSDDSESDDELISGDAAMKGSIAAGLLLVGIIGGFGAASYIYKDQINDFLLKFSDFIEGYGAAGYAIFVAGYAGLEVLAIPAIPLTMSAGLLFGTLVGTILVSIAGTIAATAAFLIARYLARDRILKLAEGNKKFLAIDRAIGENGFRVVVLLRLSPLLPLSLSNYLYGLTSVDLLSYVLGSWLGMLPGTWAYVSAGAVGRAFIQQEAEGGIGGGSEHLWTLGIGLLVTVVAATYVTRLAKDAIKDIE
ncbi:hypothetical protein GOP47_0028317 [Adiantum capillus-veneris]|nr:hypothetical protein GOP47_0028317 [Adiantum capillus-veneris]